MTVLEFINNTTHNYIQNTAAEDAYTDFIESPECISKGSLIFFKIKYNAEKIKREKAAQTPIEDVASTPSPTPVVKEKIIDAELPKRVITNYMDGMVKMSIPSLIPTGTKFDELISDRITTEDEKDAYYEKNGVEMPESLIERGGFTRQCIDITAGKAGSGKSFMKCMLAAQAKVYARREQSKKIRVGFISAEMRKSEWDKEVSDNPILKELEVDYMLQYVGAANYQDIFWEAFADYDIVVVDSLPAIISHFKMTPGERRTEKTMIFDFIRTSLGSVEKNDNNVQLINQAVKDGNYKGGTELPHMMSSMSFVNVEDQLRYTTFEKNRNNGKTCRRKLYIEQVTNESPLITFNEEVYAATYEQVADKKASIEELMQQLDNSEISLDNIEDAATDGTEMSSEEMSNLTTKDDVITADTVRDPFAENTESEKVNKIPKESIQHHLGLDNK